MGYAMHNAADNIFIAPGENKRDALLAVRKLAELPQHVAWINKRQLAETTSLEDALDEWGWLAFIDAETGAITGLRFAREKIGDEDILFAALAPFVRAGSFIEMVGEDGERWRWVFDGKSVKTVTAKVVWDA